MKMDEDVKTGLTQVPGVVVESLKTQPMLLVIVIMNLFTVGAILWFGDGVAKSRTEIISNLIERCTGPGRMSFPEPHRSPGVIDVKKEE